METQAQTPVRTQVPSRLSMRLGLRGWVYAGRYPAERYLYILHRLCGLGLILYLPLHVWVTGRRLQGPEAWQQTMAILSRPVFVAGEILVLAAFVFHAVNGFRLLFGHLGCALGSPGHPVYPYPMALHRQRRMVVVLMILSGAFLAAGVWDLLTK